MSFFQPTRLAALAILLLTWPTVVQANIGDTVEKLRGRYGSAKIVGNQMLFQHDGYSICVYFDGDKSGMEVYVRDGSIKDKTDITDEDIKALLSKESESGGTNWAWIEKPMVSGKRVFLRSDGKLIARLSDGDRGGDKFFTIMLNTK